MNEFIKIHVCCFPEHKSVKTHFIGSISKIFERELLKKLEDFYGALGWGEVLSSTKTAEKFFEF